MIYQRRRRRRTSSTPDGDSISDLLINTSDKPENYTRRRKRPNPTQSQPDQSDPQKPEIGQQTQLEEYREQCEKVGWRSQMLKGDRSLKKITQ